MERHQAINIIQNTLQNSFNEQSFTILISNLLKHIEYTPQTVYRGNIIPDAFNQYIKTMKRAGKYQDADGKMIDVLIVDLEKETSLERARAMQRNFIAWYLNGSRGGVLKDAALVAFVSPDQEDWRFSLVKMDYRLEQREDGGVKVKEEFTPARRWSFLVGKNENSHTAQSRFLSLIENDEHNPLLTELEAAFSIERVTKEFFEKYRDLFIRTKEALDTIIAKDEKIRNDFSQKGISAVDFAKKLLGQIVFLYFLQKKGWFGVARDAAWGTGPKNFLRCLFRKEIAGYEYFFKRDILHPSLNSPLHVSGEPDQLPVNRGMGILQYAPTF